MTAARTPIADAVAMRGVSKSFGPKDSGPAVLEGVDLDVAPGEILALLGASGCGKTTLLRLLAGLEKPSRGDISIFGQTAAEACRQRRVGVAFQQPALVPSRTALENVRLTLEIAGTAGADDPRQLLADFGLGRFLHHYPHQLSGGMRQRVNIACALVHGPRLLLLDEPFGALDELTRGGMMDWLAGVLARTGQTVLLVTHSVEEAVCLSDRVAIFSRRPGCIARILPVPLARPRSEAFRATAEFRAVAAKTRQALLQILGAETDVELLPAATAARAPNSPAREPRDPFEQPITPATPAAPA